jgi:hypothetical protein
MRASRPTLSLAIAIALLLSSMSATAGNPITPGFLPANARVGGHSLIDLASAFTLWAFGTSAEVNPIVAGRCERSPIDPNVWFLPVSLGGESVSTCQVPPGAFLVVTPGFIECSNIEPEPFFGANEIALRGCVDGWFDLLNRADVVLDGRPVENLEDYALTTLPVTLPPNNLLSTESGLSLSKGYFLLMSPLSRGTHTLRLYDEFETLGFQAGITITIVVG